MLAVMLLATALAVAAWVLTNLIRRLFSSYGLPRSLPWVGIDSHCGPFARARAHFTSFFNLQSLLDNGYENYSKLDKPYVLPYFINGPQVILPTSQMRWLLEQPDSVLSQEHVNRQFLEADHTFLHANLVKDPVHPEIIKHELTRQIGTFTDDIVEEMNCCLEEYWGSDTENWKEVRLYDTMLDVIARLSTRVFIGQPLCNDRDFLKTCRSFNRNVALSAAALSIFPALLKPLFAPLVTLYDYLQYQKCSRYIMPVIKERLAQARPQEKLPIFDSKISNDYVQWAINHALAKPVLDPRELDPRVISCRFSVLCFAAIQSSVITLTNCLFDVAASATCESSLDTMCKEVGSEIADAGWSKATLARMTRVDSALRESLRLNGFIERGVMKLVVAPEGVTLPDGSHIPYGTKVGISGYSVHHDNNVYEDATTYDAFRFVEAKDGKPLAFVTTSEKFMGFSHGSHACPGRFFAANQLKIALAHIVRHYEIHPIAKRPVNRWFFGHIAPPLHETLRVRRKKS
ncbi:putative Cytochrome P450 [Seiridium cardinale]|uniref:Cytochrome P450 n=1 Tax=Seiridium cardinale TaxID=138064 RepID=A0ABR2XHL5_9PEZI